MHSFLVSTPPDLPQSVDTLEISPDKSIGIEEVRRIHHFLSRRPLKSDQNTVIVHQAEKLTPPAQHALLKVLEEPPGNSRIYLVTSHPDSLLPTILSRVQSIDPSIHRYLDTSVTQASREILQKLLQAKSIGDRLSVIDSAGFTRDSALEFLVHLEYLLHSDLCAVQSIPSRHLPPIYDLIHRTRKYLSTNVNVRLAMDHFAIDLPQ